MPGRSLKTLLVRMRAGDVDMTPPTAQSATHGGHGMTMAVHPDAAFPQPMTLGRGKAPVGWS